MTLFFLLNPKSHLLGGGDSHIDSARRGFPSFFSQNPEVKKLDKKFDRALKGGELPLDAKSTDLKELLTNLSSVQNDILGLEIEDIRKETKRLEDIQKKIRLILLVMMMDD